MTSRGNPSISPPVQIPLQSQPRQVNLSGLPSGTPPPQQQFYSGPQVQGGVYDFSGQAAPPLLPYQAYGSAPNDLRGAPASARGSGGPQQQQQPNGFFAAPTQNMRPQQQPPQQGQPTVGQQYFISQQAAGMRQPRPPQTPTTVMFVPGAFSSGGNMVIQPNVYGRGMSIYPPNQQFPAYGNYPQMFYPPQAQMGRGGMINPQTQSRPAPPPPRERKAVEIKDPVSGRSIDLKEELSHERPHSNDAVEQAGDEPSVSQSSSDIPNQFARQVAARLKTPETSSVEPVQQVEGYASNGGGGEFQPQAPPPPAAQQPAQLAHPTMVRPPLQGHMMAGPSPMHPGHMLAAHQGGIGPPHMEVDLSLPPPQIRPRHPGPPAQMQAYNMPQQQPQPPQQQPQPPQQQPQPPQQQQQMGPRHTAPPVVPQQQPPQPPPLQQQQQQQQPQVPPVMVAPVAVAPPASVSVAQTTTPVVAPPAVVDEPAGDIKHIPAEVPAKVEPKAVVAPAEPTPPAATEPSPTRESSSPPKEDIAPGANIQVSKDGRKGKKGKRDYNRRDLSGSDMDFIDDKSGDSVESTDAAKPPLPPSSTTTAPPVERQPSADKAVAEKPIISYAAIAKETTPPAPAATPVAASEPVELPKAPEPASQPVAVKEVTPPVPEEPKPEKRASPVKAEGPAVSSAGPPAPQPQQSAPLPPTQQPQTPPTQQPAASPVNDENVPPKEPIQQDSRKEEAQPSKDDEGSKNPPEKTKQKMDESKEKLQYDRNYLMELRECASSQTKPEGLPNLDIILDKPNVNQVRSSSNAPLDFTPSFFQPSAGGNPRHAPQIGKSSSRGRQRPGDMPQQRIIKSVSIQNDIKILHQSANPWKPKGNTTDDGEKNSLESMVLFIMNRLTPTNFEKLAGEMKLLPIKSYEDLENLVKIFFDKVTIETKFVTAYAQLCRVLSGIKVPPPPDKGIRENQATFRVVMLTKCQQEFEADKSIVFEDPEEKRKKLRAEMEDTPDRDEKIDEVLYRMKLRRLKFYGNIRFIGELFKLGMLTENIMHDCIFRLLKARDDDSLLSLCQLITTVGQILDNEKARPRMDQYFNQMEKIAEERKSRIKFTLKDAVDLRRHHWVPRKETTGPKKIDEVHKDYQAEQVRNQILQSQPPPPRSNDHMSQPGSRRGSRQRQEEQKTTEDGWNTVGSGKSLRIDASKMKLSKNVVDEDNIQLGPGGGMNKFSMWGRGSFGGSSQGSQDAERPSPASNRFSALRNDEDRRTYQRSPSRGDTAGRGMRQGPTAGHGRGKIHARSSQEGERRDLLANARNYIGGSGRSQNSSRDNSWNREDRRPPPSMGPRGSREREDVMSRSDISRPSGGFEDMRPPPVMVTPARNVKEMSEDEMEAKAKTILEEYLNIKDLAEAKLCVSELAGQPLLYLVVTASINEVLERNNQARELTGQYLHELVKNQVISLEAYVKGVCEVLQFAEDMVIDIPMMWDYLAQVTAPLLVGGSLPWDKLSEVLKPALNQRSALTLLTKVVLQTKALSSEAEVSRQFEASGLKWAHFVEGDVDAYLKDHKLEFTVKASAGGGDLSRVGQQLETLVSQRKPEQELKALIEKMVPVENRDKNFIRMLTTAVTNASITRPEMKVNEDVIKACRELLQAYINTAQFELQALYAIQALMAKLEHPKGVIIDLFDFLYNEEIVSEDAFKQWETSMDEQEGKGACSMQLTQFFTWLRENEDVDPAS